MRRSRIGRLAVMLAVGILHLTAYYVVTRVNGARPASALWDLTTPFDARIPYLPWTWPFFWAAYPFVTLGAASVVLALPDAAFRRAILAFVGMTLVGAAVQLVLPARAPWPETPHPVQHLLHESWLVLPYANLPSMHVAFSTLTAFLALAVLRSHWVKAVFVLVTMLVALSTVTLKEHFALDAVTGAALGAATGVWWRRGTRAGAHPQRP